MVFLPLRIFKYYNNHPIMGKHLKQTEKKRSECIYGFYCKVCKTGFVSLTWDMKTQLKGEHQHEI